MEADDQQEQPKLLNHFISVWYTDSADSCWITEVDSCKDRNSQNDVRPRGLDFIFLTHVLRPVNVDIYIDMSTCSIYNTGHTVHTHTHILIFTHVEPQSIH